MIQQPEKLTKIYLASKSTILKKNISVQIYKETLDMNSWKHETINIKLMKYEKYNLSVNQVNGNTKKH